MTGRVTEPVPEQPVRRPPDDRRQVDPDDAGAVAAQELADELRRVIHRLVLVRPPVEDLRSATEGARAFADRLDTLRAREGAGEVSEAGLRPVRFLHHSPLSGACNPLAPPLALWSVVDPDGTPAVAGEVVFGPAYEGPPGHVHGGYVAAMFDELLGRAQGRPGFTGSLTVHYRRPSPLGRRFDLHARVTRVEGRKRWITGTCHVGSTLVTEAEGLFIAPRGGDSLQVLRAAQEELARRGD